MLSAAKIASNKQTLRNFKAICKCIKNDTANFYSIASKDMFSSGNINTCQTNVAYNSYNNTLNT